MTDKDVRTIADIARLAGVSKSTVSRALNDSPLISAETKSRIQALAKKHNYQAHQAARSLSLQRSHTLAFVVMLKSNIQGFANDPFILDMIGAISNVLLEYEYDLLVAQVADNEQEKLEALLSSRRVDGLIVLGLYSSLDKLERLAARQAPFIVWEAPLPDQPYCSVNCDNLKGGQLATAHLLSQGYRRVGFIGGNTACAEVGLRYKGYLNALETAGQLPNPALVSYGDFSIQSGSEAMRRLLAQAPNLDGVFVASDWMALGVLEVLRNSGRRVPEEVGVVGFDDITLAAHCSPPLTTIRQNIALGGQLLVEKLLAYLENGQVTVTTLPVELIVRETTRARG